MRRYLFALLAILLLAGCAPAAPELPADTTQTDTTTDVGSARQDPAQAALLSAFFGLDNGLPLPSNIRICRGSGREDGMPVIFSRELDPATLQAGDFQVLSATGVVGRVTCVTFAPALDPGELRTVLLTGEFGTNGGDEPVSVTISGNVLSRDGSLNFKGATIAVTPLPPGPTLVLAEQLPESQWKLGQATGAFGTGNGCPQGTAQVLRVVWAGGVTISGGAEPGEAERLLYRVTLLDAAGTASDVVPFALADLEDGDNNHLLCLDVNGTPQAVAFPAGHLADPNGDLNPDTQVLVTPGS